MPANPDLAAYPALAAARERWPWQPADACLAGRTVLVTGAGDGIGRAAARACACYGADVVLLGRTRSKLEAEFDWISDHTDTRPVVVPCDLLELGEDGAAALADAVDGEFGRLDGLLHNASLLGPKVPLAHYPADQWHRVMQVNVNAAFLLTRALLPLLDAAPQAAVLFTASSVGRRGRAFWGAYAVSKFATEGLMQVLAEEIEHTGAGVVSLNPGGTATAMRASAYPGEDPATLPSPEDHMALYLYLLSGGAAAHHGQALDARGWAGPAATGS